MRPELGIRTSDSLIFFIPGTKAEYEIEHDQMDTPQEVLGWISHLCEKNWVTLEHIEALLEVAEYNGVEIR
jgi:hypothetical protein